jgi:squalene synthase HpnC
MSEALAAQLPLSPTLALLRQFGPEAVEPTPTLSVEQARAYCRGLALSHYENFSVLTRLVPESLREDFAAVYAFCRWADDLADETGADEAARARSTRLLGWWREELRGCFAFATRPFNLHPEELCTGETPVPPKATTPSGLDARCPYQPTHPVFIALAETARKHRAHGLTSQPFDDLIRAFEQDQVVRRYQTWEQVVDYCTRSADPVGRIVLMLGGYAPPTLKPENAERYRLSDLTCTALQLINFWQDVQRDLLERDRVYLPEAETGVSAEVLREWLRRGSKEGGYDPAARVAFIRMLKPLVERTAVMFEESRSLSAMLDPSAGSAGSGSIGPVVGLFHAGGEAILKAVRAGGYTTLWRRPRLGKVTKGALLGRAMLGRAMLAARRTRSG